MFAPIEAIKDLLTGSIWDKFKEMIEPYALVSSIVFLALNLALVYPAMGNLASNPFFTALAGASDLWKLAAGTIIVFIFSYLINQLSTFFLDFASGKFFRDSPFIGKWLKAWQIARYNKLVNASKKLDLKPDLNEEDYQLERDRAAFRLAYEFPVKESELGLTNLGNLLLNAPSYVSHQYGASMQLVWPILQEKIPDDNKTLKTIQASWTALSFFTSLYGLLILVAIELISFAALGSKGIDIGQIIGLLVCAVIFYYASLAEAHQYGGGMRRLFDSRIKDYFSDLGMEGLKDLNPASSEYKPDWQEVMGWLAYGAINEGEKGDLYNPQQKWYKAEPKPAPEEWPKLKHPDFLHVETIPCISSKKYSSQKEGKEYICTEKTVEYLFAVTNTSIGENPLSGKEAYLLVQDTGVAPPNTVNGYLSRLSKGGTSPGFNEILVKGKRQAGKPAGVLFPLGNVPPGSSRVLTYSFESVLAKVTTDINFTIKRIEPGENKSFQFIDIFPEQITQNAEASLTIEMLDDAQTTLISNAEICIGKKSTYPISEKMTDDKRTGVWHLRTTEPGEPEKIRIYLDRSNKGG